MITTYEKLEALIVLTANLENEDVPEIYREVVRGWYNANELAVALSVGYAEGLLDKLTESGEQLVESAYHAWCEGMDISEDEAWQSIMGIAE
jgi:hypothetical protein